jgi:trans-2-enoyl-CoA reductase
MNQKLLYVKDEEGFVTVIEADNMTSEYIEITKEEFEEISGYSYYKKHFLHL